VWHTPKQIDRVRLDEDAKQRAPTLVSARGLLDLNRICAIRGREQEHKEILSFCRKALTSSPDAESRVPKAMYISGKPGIGKTAVVMSVCAHVADSRNARGVAGGRPHIAAVNATTLMNPLEVYHRLATEAAIACGKKDYIRASTFDAAKRDCEKFLAREKGARMMLVVIDEIDHLFSRGQDVLYDLFGLASRMDTRMVLLGMANSLNMIEKFLPKLRERMSEPHGYTFTSYTKEQIEHILVSRIPPPHDKAFEPKAIELCTRKVESTSGDIRKALECCRIAVDKATEDKSPQVRVKHMMHAMNHLWSDKSTTRISELSQQQKLVLIGLAKLSGGTEVRRQVTFERGHEVVKLFFKKNNLNNSSGQLSAEDFRTVVEFLESNGLVKVTYHKSQPQQSQLVLLVGFSEIQKALKKTTLFEDLMKGSLDLKEAREAQGNEAGAPSSAPL